MKFLLTLIAVFVMIVGGLIAFLFSGAYNVAASLPHTRPVAWAFELLQERSIERHARGLSAPALDDPRLVRRGLVGYHSMCVTCHGAPGVEASEIGTGLYPAPPDLQAEAAEWSDTELYWTIANGIKMSGMPAFAPTHEPDELWSLVAFVKTLPNVTPETYRSMVAAAGLEMPTSAHRHGARSGERPARGPGGSDHPHP